MRNALLRIALAAGVSMSSLVAAGTASAQSPIMSINSINHNLLPDECKRRGSETLRLAGAPQFTSTQDAVWGRSRDGRYMVTVYCVPSANVAVFVATGDNGNVTHSWVDNLVSAWRQAQ